MRKVLPGMNPHVALATAVLQCAVEEAKKGSAEATEWIRGESLWFDIICLSRGRENWRLS